MTFAHRVLAFTFKLGTGSFGETGFNVVKVSGLRAQAHIVRGGGDSVSEAQVKIFGMTPDMLNALTALTTVAMVQRRNVMIIEAGDENGLSVAYQGDIVQAWADLNDQPNSALQVWSRVGLVSQLRPALPISFPGNTSVATIMQSLAQTMGYNFENNGVTVQLAKPYYGGSAFKQAQKCAEQANINMMVDDTTLAIWPKDGARFGGTVPIISTQTGMSGSPSFNGVGISVGKEYDPTIHFGQNVQVQSAIKQACGTWNVNALSHSLSTETPNGDWFTYLSANPLTNINGFSK